MKLHASASPFESVPPSVWVNFKNAVGHLAREWGIPLTMDEDLSVRDAEARFIEWTRRPLDGE